MFTAHITLWFTIILTHFDIKYLNVDVSIN